MACSKCKQKVIRDEPKNLKPKPIIEADRIITWVIIAWLFLGCYGLYSLIKDIFNG